MGLSKSEQDWVRKNMSEDFTIGFTRKIRFVGGVALTHETNVDIDEAESDGYFCQKCGKTEIENIEEHVKECMNFKATEGEDYLLLLTMVNGGQQWTLDAGKTFKDALERASQIRVDGATVRVIKIIGDYENPQSSN